ncbi:MAG: response regulator transcription factor [Rikenellaceae bacterium]|nr:response regulator transcription factor [Rikenellaceae bacterium]
MEEAKNKIIVVDDHSLFRRGLKGLLNAAGSCTVVGEAADGEEFLALLDSCDGEIVLLDIDMPKMNGIEAAAAALERRPDLKIITLSMHGEDEYYFKMVSQGVKGFLLKNSEIDEVLAAISTVAKGGSYFSQELLQNLVGSFKTSRIVETDRDGETLSEREREILLLICQGLSNHEIADKLFISKRTVDKHRANILDKTGCRNTANLVVYAIKNSLVEI